jgi:hypothetical protein
LWQSSTGGHLLKQQQTHVAFRADCGAELAYFRQTFSVWGRSNAIDYRRYLPVHDKCPQGFGVEELSMARHTKARNP